MSLPETYKVRLPSPIPGGKPFFEEKPLTLPGENQVLVKVEFAPIHHSDIAALQGHLNIPNQPLKPCGAEGSGIVVAVGINLKVSHKIGDKVFIVGPGTYSQYITAKSEDVQTIPEGLSLEEAALHFLNPSTAYYMGTLAEGHKAAIHTVGASPVGRMLIRYFKHLGIKLINIVRKEQYVEELKKEGADYVLNSEAPDFEEKLKEIAERENATISFDAISGEFTNKVLKAQPPKSICYVYGLLTGYSVNSISIMELFKGKVVAGFRIKNLAELAQKEGELAKFCEGFHKLLTTVFSTKVQKIFSIDQLDEALAFYNENSSMGKILLRPNN